MIKQIESYVIDQKNMSVDDFVEFKLKGEEHFKRGIVSYVDRNTIKVVRRYHDQISISAHNIGTGMYEVRKLDVSNGRNRGERI